MHDHEGEEVERRSFQRRLSDSWDPEHVYRLAGDLENRVYDPRQAPSYQNVGEHVAIQEYQRLGVSLNTQLREGRLSPELQGVFGGLMGLMQPLGERVVVYRGMGGESDAQVGGGPSPPSEGGRSGAGRLVPERVAESGDGLLSFWGRSLSGRLFWRSCLRRTRRRSRWRMRIPGILRMRLFSGRCRSW